MTIYDDLQRLGHGLQRLYLVLNAGVRMLLHAVIDRPYIVRRRGQVFLAFELYN